MNNRPEISIICPSIRPSNLEAVYNSILSSFKRSFGLIIVSPYQLPKELQDKENIKFIRDFGSPGRAQCLGASLAEGLLFKWVADDGIMFPNALDENIKLLYSMGDDYKNVVAMKYLEGTNGTDKPLQSDDYFKVNGSDWSSSPYIPNNYWLFNEAIMYRSFFEELGGWSTMFDGTWYAHTDLAVRAQFNGAYVKMSDIVISDYGHNQNDHKPIEIAQTFHDKPIYKSILFESDALSTIS